MSLQSGLLPKYATITETILRFFENVVTNTACDDVAVSKELAVFFNKISAGLAQHKNVLNGSISNEDRKRIMDVLGEAGSNYRSTIYENRFSGDKQTISKQDLINMKACRTGLDSFVRQTNNTDEPQSVKIKL